MLKKNGNLSHSCGSAFAQHESRNCALCGWSIGDGIGPLSLRTSDIGKEPYEVVNSSVWEKNPEVVILDRFSCTGINLWDTAVKGNWNKSSHDHKPTKILMTWLSWSQITARLEKLPLVWMIHW